MICRATHANCSTCVPLRTLGQTCAANADCEGELICLETTSPGSCSEHVPEGGRCSDTDECGGDGELLCNLGLETPICERGFSKVEGEPCSSDSLCLTDLICNEGLENPACTAYGQVGDPCGDRRDCAPDLACNASTTSFECAPTNQVGNLCYRDSECPDGTICHRARREAWVCRAPSSSGESCGWDDDCANDLICVQDQCSEPTLEGEPCTHPFECERAESGCGPSASPECVSSYMVCIQVDNVCALQREAGGRCAEGTDCRDDLVCNTAVEPAECRSPGETGASCESVEDCADNFDCVEGECQVIVCP